MTGVRFQPASDQSLLVSFGQQITLDAHQRVTQLLRLLASEPIADIRNLHPAYCSLLIKFDPLKIGHKELEAIVQTYLDRLENVTLPEPRQMEIPVCYGGDYGPDLNDVAAMHDMKPEHVIELHVSVNYHVYFLGFVPGFAYLGEMPAALLTPRLPSPRRRVPAGSVGIAGTQTAIYPFATPGGWRLLGRTPVQIFRPERSVMDQDVMNQDAMSLLSIGDRVRFTPISPETFAALEQA
jgi:KipI family sensor histidine kinase inhibitor